MPATADPFPTAIRARTPLARPTHGRHWRAPSPAMRPTTYGPGTCVPEPPSDACGRPDGGDAGPGGGFWAVLRCVLAATAGR